MPDVSTILSLPLILPAQAQKHVTHNEALRLLDVAVQLAVANRDLGVPPALPAVGDRHIVAGGASGPWAGREGDVALYTAEGWAFTSPLPGWRAHVLAEGVTVVFDGAGWVAPAAGPLTPTLLGVNTTASTTNRLAVSAPATLLNHEGGGHQLKVNKAANSDTASLLFQTGFSGRAEMGLAGSNDFAIKVSPDGASFQEALKVDAASGIVTLAQGVQAASGSAALPGIGFAADTDTGLHRPAADQIGMAVGGVQRALLTSTAFDAVNLTRNGAQVFARDNILGLVSQSAGVPTGAVIERGSNVNGAYVRFADGTQICWVRDLSPVATETAVGPLYSSGVSTPWTFPAVFSAAPMVAAQGQGSFNRWTTVFTVTTTEAPLRQLSPISSTVLIAHQAMAVGRWY